MRVNNKILIEINEASVIVKWYVNILNNSPISATLDRVTLDIRVISIKLNRIVFSCRVVRNVSTDVTFLQDITYMP